MNDPIRYEIPKGQHQRACRSCSAPIYWIVTPAGKRCPVNPDGVSHFATCPNASQHSKKGKASP